jgi:outer membrane protein assembly factor BamB
VIITESGRQLQALNPRTGEVLWSTEVPVDRVKVTNESLFLTHSAGKELVSWDKQTRERNWSLERPTNEPPRTTLFKPVITDAYGLFAGGHGLVVFDPETGEKQWETSVENAINNPPVMLDGRVWMSTGDSLLGFDIETGETVRTQNLVAKIRDVLVVDTLLIVLMENQIAAFSVQER